MEKRLIIIRRSNLADFFGATVFQLCRGDLIAATDKLTEPDEKLINDIHQRNIFIVGNYFSGYLEKLQTHCNYLEVFYNHFETVDKETEHTFFLAEKDRGFATYAVKSNSIKLEEIKEGSYSFLLNIAEMIDEFYYGFPSEDTLDFYNGVLSLSDKTMDIEKLSLVTNEIVPIDFVKKRGNEARSYNFPVIKARTNTAKDSRICDKYTVQVCLGKDNVLETCRALSEKHGIAFLMNYDKDRKGTNIFCGVSRESNYDSREVLMDYIGNSNGTIALSSGFMPGLCELYKLFC